MLLGMFIYWPFLALVLALVLGLLYFWCRRSVVLVAAIAWLAYFPYEQAMKLRILCSGECNIRVDLLLFYPILALFTIRALIVCIKTIRAPRV
jgi:hypothetical protein